MKNRLFSIVLAFFVLVACRRTPAPASLPYSATKSQVFDSAAVVSPHPLASDVGLAVLQKGGNAIDAVVAVQLVLAVVYPRAGNIGGGGFLVYRQADGLINALDYREKAPALAERNMFLDSLEQPIEGLSIEGHLAAGVPGTIAGLVEAHSRYGSLPWSRLVEPAIMLAQKGFPISQTEAERLNRFQEDFKEYNKDSPFLKETWQEGDLLIQEELAETLRLIQERGRAGFYAGTTADLIVAEMETGDGIITHRDLLDYRAAWRTPIVGHYDDYKVIAMPPASSGGVALLQMLGMIEPYPIHEYGFQSVEATHLMAEAERRAYADRAEYLGDSDYFPVPIDSLIDESYLAARMTDFSVDEATASETTEAGDFILNKETFETTHTSIVDAYGNAVAVTTTLNSNYGCKVIVDGAGFFLNNEMDDFSIKPGFPNQFGLVGAEANAIVAGKRMLSSMTPTIIEKGGQLFMVIGTPGGSTIITSVFQVFINVAEFGMPLDSAVLAPRFHHQWLPDEIRVEPHALSEKVRSELSTMGHEVRQVKTIARVKAIHCLPDGRLHGVGDHRNPDDDTSGY